MLLGIDIGGTTAKMALLDQQGTIYARCEIPSFPEDDPPTKAEPHPLLRRLIRGATALLTKNNITDLEGIGVSAAGQINTSSGVVIGTNGRFPGYDGTPLKAGLEEAFHVPVWALNDANAAALGECFTGRAKGLKNVLMVTLGTGVGGGIVINGEIYGGHLGIAGEIGHFTLYQDGPLCPCGKRGCFELYASTRALVESTKALFESSDSLTECSKTSENTSTVSQENASKATDTPLNGRIIFQKASEGDPLMLRSLDHWLDDVAAGIGGLVHIFDPEMILIGGGVSTQETLLIEPLRKKVAADVMPRYAEHLCIEAATLGNDAGVVGAVRFWMQCEHLL